MAVLHCLVRHNNNPAAAEFLTVPRPDELRAVFADSLPTYI